MEKDQIEQSKEEIIKELLTALEDVMGWFTHSEVNYVISHKLGEQSDYHRVSIQARTAIRNAKKQKTP